MSLDHAPLTDAIELALHRPRLAKKGIRLGPRRREPASPFGWPLRVLAGIEPQVLASHAGERLGVDLGYADARELRDVRVPVFAVNDGKVACAIENGNGCAISLDHSGTWTTHYAGLSELTVIRCQPRLERRESVRAGQIIGYTSKPRIGFELWKWTDDRGFVAVDPRHHLARWTRTTALMPAKEAA
jgi:hypothetical protein